MEGAKQWLGGGGVVNRACPQRKGEISAQPSLLFPPQGVKSRLGSVPCDGLKPPRTGRGDP